MTITKLFIAGLVLGVLGVAAYQMFSPTSEPSSIRVGAVSGPDLYSPYFSVNGVTSWYNRKNFNQASTTICAIQSPTSATSTLGRTMVRFSTSSTTASTITIAKATTAFATTTSIGTDYAISANAEATIVASTTATAGDATIFAPGNWLVVGMKGGTGTFSPVGFCQATFEQI